MLVHDTQQLVVFDDRSNINNLTALAYKHLFGHAVFHIKSCLLASKLV
jgi:hypothetical protein